MSSRQLCRFGDIGESGALGFAVGDGDWPLQLFVVRRGERVFGYVNRCPHAGHQLNWRPHRFFDKDEKLLLCASHGAVFEPETGLCVAGPCLGQSLTAVPLTLDADRVLVDDAVLSELAADYGTQL